MNRTIIMESDATDTTVLSSAHEAKASRCACFGELGFNDEAKASWFEPNLSLSSLIKEQALKDISEDEYKQHIRIVCGREVLDY